MLSCSVENGAVVLVCLWGGVGVGVGALDTAKMLSNFLMASMVWAPKRARGAAGVGLARALARRIAASVAALAEYIVGMVPMCVCLCVCVCVWGAVHVLRVHVLMRHVLPRQYMRSQYMGYQYMGIST